MCIVDLEKAYNCVSKGVLRGVLWALGLPLARLLVWVSDYVASWAPPAAGVLAMTTNRRPLGRPRTHWRDYRCSLAWENI